ncbi:MAG: NAD(P)H-quinone oxidoreductase [Hyphomicrobiales bacterium]|nr:MAG: NAD(P)H-quinone oxidoreductase [Hyphomicrobiales bacterium]
MTPEKMKTIEIREFGGPEVLTIGERALPEFATDQILVKIAAAGVNGPDLVQRRGHYPPPKGASDLLGLEVSGEVIACGGDVSQWNVGDNICALTNGGGYAEYVAIDAGQCLPVPHGVSVEDAAGIPETYFTVWSNLFFNQDLPKDGLLLVHGGAGGIGSAAIQLGAAQGLRVFTTCSSAENAKFCESLGAEKAINYREEDFVEIVKDAGGADLIVDIVGGDYIGRNIAAARLDGRIVQLAFNKGAKVEVNLMPVMIKRLTYTGSTLRPRPPEFKTAVATDLREKIWPLFESGKLSVNTYKTFALGDATKAHEMIEAGGHRGKILLTP